ncbi:hypothetical protein Plec18170_009701 [Paecilomyces lecythidis]
MDRRGYMDLLEGPPELAEMEAKGYCLLKAKQPLEYMAKDIEDAIGQQLYEASDNNSVTRHFEGHPDSSIWKAAETFLNYGVNAAYISQTFLGIRSDEVNWEPPRVVRCQKIRKENKTESHDHTKKPRPSPSLRVESVNVQDRISIERTMSEQKEQERFTSEPLMVGPSNYVAGTAILLIRPLRRSIGPDCGFPWIYEGSHRLKPSEAKQGSLDLKPLSVGLDDILLVYSASWARFLEYSGEDAVFVCQPWQTGMFDPVNRSDEPGYVSDGQVFPFTRIERELEYLYAR